MQRKLTVRCGVRVPLPYSDEEGKWSGPRLLGVVRWRLCRILMKRVGGAGENGWKGREVFRCRTGNGGMGQLPLLHHGVETLGTVCGSAAKPGFRVQVREFPMRA